MPMLPCRIPLANPDTTIPSFSFLAGLRNSMRARANRNVAAPMRILIKFVLA